MINMFGGKLKWLEGKTIVFLGDSITADNKSNYVSLFLDNLTESIDVSKLRILNFGVDSSSVLDMFDRSPDVLDECKPDLISIFLGVNDSKIFHHVNKPLMSPLVANRQYISVSILHEITDSTSYRFSSYEIRNLNVMDFIKRPLQ